MAAPAIALSEVTKKFGDRTALDSVDFTVRSGESVGYLGPNGAGKSTTMKLLIGLLRPDSGRLEVDGLDPVHHRIAALARVGALVESPGSLPYMHGEDLLEHVAEIRGLPSREWHRAAVAAATATGVDGHLGRPMGTLSTGLGRRLLLAAALVGEPSVILLDEPTLGLDPAGRRDLRELLRGLRREGRTLLMSTHLLDDVEAVCERVLFLRDGRLVGDEPVRRDVKVEAEHGERCLLLRFAGEIEADRLRAAVGSGAALTAEGDRDWRLEFVGDERRQSELIGQIVAARLPLSRASVPESDLARRYLELVGREEG
ncbi:MAG: ABC transporter ATP-binding protein [Thermoplasmata archaeon]|nr:ABC transporter ATP-binding protein [Thermoplasmata archaeon]